MLHRMIGGLCFFIGSEHVSPFFSVLFLFVKDLLKNEECEFKGNYLVFFFLMRVLLT